MVQSVLFLMLLTWAMFGLNQVEANSETVMTVTTANPATVADGQCSLIEAIINANQDAGTHADCPAGSGADSIELANNTTYTLLTPHNSADDGAGLPLITSNITIQGNGATIERSPDAGTPDFRLLYVFTNGNLTIYNLTLTNGSANVDGSGLGGGAILNQGTLTLQNVSILDNHSGTHGGGLSNYGGIVIVDNSAINENSTVSAGGGIRNRNGDLNLSNSTLNNNVSSSELDAGAGGGLANHAIEGDTVAFLTNVQILNNVTNGLGGAGIDNSANSNRSATLDISDSEIGYNVANGADHTEGLGGGIQNSFFRGTSNAFALATIDQTTIHHNSATDGGGISTGIDLPTNLQAILTLTNSTVSYNSANGSGFVMGNGGGIYNVNGALTVANSTISQNMANGSGDVSGLGGGVLNVALNAGSTATLINVTLAHNSAAVGGGAIGNLEFSDDGETFLQNSLIAGNTAASDPSCYNFQATLTSHGNNLEDQNGCQLSQPTDLVNTDPLLGILGDNGGATETYALLPSSPAINAGNNTACAASPVNNRDQRGVLRPQEAVCDMGAYEAEWAAVSFDISYQYWLNDGSSGTGRYWLLADGQYVDGLSQTGSWSFQPSPARFLLQADAGTACDQLAIGRFISPTQLFGFQICQDGSGNAGIWLGSLTN